MSTPDPSRTVSRPVAAARAVVRAARMARLRALTSAELQLGEDVRFGANAVLAAPSFVHVGTRVSFGRDFHLETNLVVGDDVLISSRVAIIGNDHRFDDPRSTVFSQGRNAEQTARIEGDNLIGFGSIVIGGVTIGRGCIVGAGSIITRDLPPGTVCVGAPAKPIRDRYAPAFS